MSKKFSTLILILVILVISSMALAAPGGVHFSPAKSGSGAPTIARSTITAARGQLQVARASLTTFYFNPITFLWDVFEGDAKYKLKAAGNKGGLVKSTVLVADCDTQCEVPVEFPKTPQVWTASAKVFDASNTKIAKITFDDFQTAVPVKAPLTSPVDGASVSGNSITFLWDYPYGATKITVKVKFPNGDTSSFTDLPENLCDQDFHCVGTLSTDDQTNFPDGAYSWKVIGKGAYGKSAASTNFVVSNS